MVFTTIFLYPVVLKLQHSGKFTEKAGQTSKELSDLKETLYVMVFEVSFKSENSVHF